MDSAAFCFPHGAKYCRDGAWLGVSVSAPEGRGSHILGLLLMRAACECRSKLERVLFDLG
jgi:hypothetical protein